MNSSPKRINNEVTATRIYDNNNTKMTSINRLKNYGRILSNKNRYEILFFNKKNVYDLMNVLEKEKEIKNKVKATIDTTKITEKQNSNGQHIPKKESQLIANIVKSIIPFEESNTINFKKFNNDLYLNNITLLERMSSFRIYSYYEDNTIDFKKLDYKIINENNSYENYIRFKYIIDLITLYQYPPEVIQKLEEISQKISPQSINKIEDLIKYSNIKNKSNNNILMKSILEEINLKNTYIDYFIILDVKKNWLRRINKINKIGNSNNLSGGVVICNPAIPFNICIAGAVIAAIIIIIVTATIKQMNNICNSISTCKKIRNKIFT
jgi:uncharacterized protein YlbG (UPF0298 family)